MMPHPLSLPGVAARPRRASLALSAGSAALAILGLAPLVLDNPFLLATGALILLNVIGAVSLHLIIRTGHISLAHAGFMGVGAYACALSVLRFDLPPAIGLGIGAAAAGALALLVGPVLLRLTGKYFVLVTFLLGEIIRLVLVEWQSVTGGASGLSNLPPLNAAWTSPLAQYYVALAAAALTVLLCVRLLLSETGRAIDAVREAPQLTECTGVRGLPLKVGVFVLGCALAGVQGGLLAFFMRYIDPSTFGMAESLNLVVMNVVGGMYNVVGPILGAVFLVALPELLRGYVEIQRILFGVALIVVMAAFPAGIAGLAGWFGGRRAQGKTA
ncbi:branched-chain amino acid ABC transporter permease [Achromobacter sp. DH1f]|uniref:branched-chain amino acid ABC transporter permease n=1 Tax=Achromobacter sp. DH1f TaxID=1397275 RepID=UPI0004680E02|nr:branched-chain amino acid ABC transporter permease [Achromobacter sp. DH1f]